MVLRIKDSPFNWIHLTVPTRCHVVLIVFISPRASDNFIRACHWSMTQGLGSTGIDIMAKGSISVQITSTGCCSRCAPEQTGMGTSPVSVTEIAVWQRVLHRGSMVCHNLLQWQPDEARGKGGVFDGLPFISVGDDIFINNPGEENLSTTSWWEGDFQVSRKGKKAHVSPRETGGDGWLRDG